MTSTLGSLAPLALLLVLKVTVLFGIAALVVTLLRRRSAAARHFVWLLALAGCMALLIVPPLPGRFTVQTRYWPSPVAAQAAAAASTSPTSVQSTSSADNLPPPAPKIPLGAWLAWLWLAGSVCVAAWYASGCWRLARLARSAVAVRNPRWAFQLGQGARALGVSAAVQVRASHAVGSPLVCGLWQPIVLIPSEAEDWPDDRRRVVVLHELAHVARRDVASQRLAMLACVVFWFHPGVWFATSRLRAESERACDDLVLGLGVGAADYAQHLLDVAKDARELRAAGSVAIAMARRSSLESRLRSVLAEGLRRGVLSVRARSFAIVLGSLGCLTLAGIQLVARANESSQADEPGAPYHDVVDAGSGGTLVLRLDSGASLTIRGWDRRQVSVDGRLAGKNWRDQAVSLEREGDRVVLRANPKRSFHSFSTNNHFDIRVPARFDVELHSAGGGVTIESLEGDIRGTTGGGELWLSRLRGSADLSTGGGEVEVSDSDLRGNVSTGGGGVRLLRVRGGLRGSSGSGPVIYGDSGRKDAGAEDLDQDETDDSGSSVTDRSETDERPWRARGKISIAKDGGSIALPSAPHGARVGTGGGEVDIGRSAGMVEATTGGGNMRFGPVLGSLVATTGAGDVHVELGWADEARTVNVSSGKGTIVLFVPTDLGVDLDLETAYTESHGPTHVHSDVPVETQTTTRWDSREGTPRKYVRAHGTTGRGRVRVRIKTVNGDIEIRRR